VRGRAFEVFKKTISARIALGPPLGAVAEMEGFRKIEDIQKGEEWRQEKDSGPGGSRPYRGTHPKLLELLNTGGTNG